MMLIQVELHDTQQSQLSKALTFNHTNAEQRILNAMHEIQTVSLTYKQHHIKAIQAVGSEMLLL